MFFTLNVLTVNNIYKGPQRDIRMCYRKLLNYELASERLFNVLNNMIMNA